MAIASPDRTPSDEVMDFLLSAPTPETVISLRPSQAAQERLRYLLDGNRNEALNDAERAAASYDVGSQSGRTPFHTKENTENILYSLPF